MFMVKNLIACLKFYEIRPRIISTDYVILISVELNLEQQQLDYCQKDLITTSCRCRAIGCGDAMELAEVGRGPGRICTKLGDGRETRVKKNLAFRCVTLCV